MIFIHFFFTLFFIAINANAKICQGYGPQAPRNISDPKGTNKIVFSKAPNMKKMNLCNIHFHKSAEHKGPQFSTAAFKKELGGFQCNKASKLSDANKANLKLSGCTNIQPGDTIEVHWVFTSCNVKPGKSLSACLSNACINPQLRVETEVFLLTNDGEGYNFEKIDYQGKKSGFHQPGELTNPKGSVEYLGSTTGSKFNQKKCSPFQVTWNVRPTCRNLDIRSLHKWCKTNIFKENYAHSVRKLVTHLELLSDI